MHTTARRSDCPLNVALEIFGDRWSLLILRDVLILEKARYGEFLVSAEGISTNILASRLKQLQCAGLIEKFHEPQDRKVSFYLPTEKGISLIPLVLEVIRWGVRHLPHTGVPEFMQTACEQGPDDLIARCAARREREKSRLGGCQSSVQSEPF